MAALLLYLIGAAGAGKSSVFDALTQTPEGPSFASKSGHRFGMVKVPDARLDALRGMFNPRKFTPAEVTFVDVALPGGETSRGFSQLNAFLSDADAFALVVQMFGEYDGAGRPLDPIAQMESILLDLSMADLEKVERRIEKIEQEMKRGIKTGEPELPVLRRCREALEAGTALRDIELSDDEAKRISGFRFLSQKNLLVIVNKGEDRLAETDEAPLREAAARHGLSVIGFCAPLEAEIAGLAADEQRAFLSDYGLSQPARARLVQEAYRVLDLIAFFTVGEDEVRAWTICRGTPAQQAAGKIHTDIARGFIRAETVACEDLLREGSLAACRTKGLLRLEGKEYTVRDADVIDFRFSA